MCALYQDIYNSSVSLINKICLQIWCLAHYMIMRDKYNIKQYRFFLLCRYISLNFNFIIWYRTILFKDYINFVMSFTILCLQMLHRRFVLYAFVILDLYCFNKIYIYANLSLFVSACYLQIDELCILYTKDSVKNIIHHICNSCYLI